MGHTPNRVDRLLIRTATAARAGMATTADISTGVHPANGRGKRIFGSRCHHQHQPWSIPLTDQPILTAHIACRLKGSLQHFGEFLGWCHPVEGLSRASVELVGCEVEILLGECCHVGAFGEVLA